jgi:hypothetical protein
MDASDTTKRRKAIAYYVTKISELVTKNPKGDCMATTCCSDTKNCAKTFDSYEHKLDFQVGLKECLKCPK